MKIDLHVHTNNSGDCDMTFREVEEAAIAAGLDGVAITDHSQFQVFKSKRLLIIPGEEVATDSGEIIGLGLRKKIERDLSPEETIRQIHGQGGIAVAPHPFDYFRKGLGVELKYLNVDAVETWNSRCLFLRLVRLAERFAEERNLPQVGGSDAHTPGEIGNAFTQVNCRKNIDAILKAIRSGSAKAEGHLSSPLVHIGSYKARLKKRL